MQLPKRVIEALDIVRRACLLGDYDSNVIGMAGEIIATEVFGIRRAKRGTQSIDGWLDNQSVQVKTCGQSRLQEYKKGVKITLSARHTSDRLLIFFIPNSGESYHVLYDGRTAEIGTICGKKKQTRVIYLCDCLRFLARSKKWQELLNLASQLQPFLPDSALACLLREYSLHELKRPSETQNNHLRQVLDLFPDAPDWRYILACLAAEKETFEKAEKLLSPMVQVGTPERIKFLAKEERRYIPLDSEITKALPRRAAQQ
jgi:hypothetical protein